MATCRYSLLLVTTLVHLPIVMMMCLIISPIHLYWHIVSTFLSLQPFCCFFQGLRHFRQSLPHIARLCLVGTYIEDGFRMWFDWWPQSQYMQYSWNCGSFLAHVFVIVNLIGQLVGSALVISRKYATVACWILLGITVLQVSVDVNVDLHLLPYLYC